VIVEKEVKKGLLNAKGSFSFYFHPKIA